MPKTHECWVRYYLNLDRISAASGVSLQSLRSGDSRGNPYMWDENEGEGGDYCREDGRIAYFKGVGVSSTGAVVIPKLYPKC